MSLALPYAARSTPLSVSGLLRNDAFVKVWAGQAVSQMGSQVTLLALPLAAIGLDATAGEMGLLRAAQYLPCLLIGLLAGVWVDRMPRRPLLIGSDLGRAVLLGSLPLAAALGVLRLEYLYVVALLVGGLTIIFDVALQSYLPGVVEREDLVDANSKLEMSRSMGFTAGPGFGGALIELASAPFAILLDALSFFWSACLVLSIRAPEPRPVAQPQGSSLRGDIGEGLSIIFRHPLLRSLAGCSATMNLFNHALFAVLLLYVARDLALPATTLGVIVAALGIGGFAGAPLAGFAARRLGLGRTIAGAALLPGLGALLAVAADPSASSATICLLTLSQFVLGLAPTIYNVNSVSLRQAIAPEHLRGRVNASMRFVMWSTMPIGSLLGGGLAEVIGIRATLALAALGLLLASSWVVFSPVARLRQTP